MKKLRRVQNAFWGLVVVGLMNQIGGVSAQEPTRDDILRGQLSPPRTCYDVIEYRLDVRIDPNDRSVSGSNLIVFEVVHETDLLQVDLFANMQINRILLDGEIELNQIEREENSFFIKLPKTLEQSSQHELDIQYAGKPQVAARPPWDGGFTWARDNRGNPWIAVTSQGTGSSLWWPQKDHPSDEPERMTLAVTVPPGLENVSNGRLIEKVRLDDEWTTFVWEISYPINNYCVTINVGKFAYFSDVYESFDGELLTLDYYVLPENLETAKAHFEQTKTMLSVFEKYFGKYPFYRDGFKLIESPHLGMEHQSAIAYGNGYQGGYLGRSASEVGRKFDFIIIHEAAHEWWGNSLTMSDNADLWIHESFAAYAEALYVEDVYGREESLEYINAKKRSVRNVAPIIGPYDLNQSGHPDMYDKGQLVLNTLRSVLDDDDLWFSILLGLQRSYRYQNINADIVFDYINRSTGQNLNYFFDQYFRSAKLPVLELRFEPTNDTFAVQYRWRADVEDFRMPIQVTTAPDTFETIRPSPDWQTIRFESTDIDEFEVATDLFYIEVERTEFP